MMTARFSDKDTKEDINKIFRPFNDDKTVTIKEFKESSQRAWRNYDW